MAARKIGTAVAEPGTRADGVIPVGRRPGGGSLDIPVIVLQGAQPGPTFWVDGTIHGDEPEGPYAIHVALREIDPKRLRGTLVAVPVIHVQAFEAAQRGNPFDGHSYDMNRIYPGKPDGFPTERIAYAHSIALKENADYGFQIHSGGDHSYLSPTIFYPTIPGGQEFARALGPAWDILLKGGVSKASPMGLLGDLGKVTLTVELGGRCDTFPPRFRHNGRALADAILNAMRHLKMIDGEPVYAKKWYVGVQKTVLAPTGGLWIAEDGVIREKIRAGTVLGRIYDLYGRELEAVRAPVDGVPFGLRTNPTVHQGDWACFFGEIHEEVV